MATRVIQWPNSGRKHRVPAAATGIPRCGHCKAVPTLMVMRGGQVIARQAGAAPIAMLRARIDDALANKT